MTKKTVLIIEDDKEDAAMLCSIIGALNHNCDVMASAEKAFEAIKTKDYDVAFVDMVLPGRSGAEFVHYVMEKEPKMKIVFVSGVMPQLDQFATGSLISVIIKPISKNAIGKALL